MSKNNPLTVLVPRKDYHLSSSSSDSSLDTQPDAPRKSVSTLLKERKDKINAAVDARNNALKARVAGSKKNGQASVKANLSNGMSTPTNAFTTVRHASKRAPPLDTAWVSTASKKPKTHKEWHPVPSDFRPPYGYKLVPDEMCPSPLFKTNKYDRNAHHCRNRLRNQPSRHYTTHPVYCTQGRKRYWPQSTPIKVKYPRHLLGRHWHQLSTP